MVRVRVPVRARVRGRFRCHWIIDSWLPVRDPWGSGAGCRYRIHDQKAYTPSHTHTS